MKEELTKCKDKPVWISAFNYTTGKMEKLFLTTKGRWLFERDITKSLNC